MPDRYRKKPIIIEARQFPTDGTPAVAHAIYQWVEKNTLGSFEPLAVIEGREPWPESGVTIDPRDGRMVIATLEGGHWVTPGDFIIRGVQGEFYPCKSDIFEATYEPAETAPAHHETPDLAELRRLLDVNRERDFHALPWHAWDRGIGYELHVGATCRDEMEPRGYCEEVNNGFRETFGAPEAELIVAAVNALPALLDAAAELAAAREADA